MATINIKGKDKAEVLVALYNHAKPLGLGVKLYDSTPMKVEEAKNLLKGETYFDYIKGRVLKVDMSGDELDVSLYDRDNGHGAAERALKNL